MKTLHLNLNRQHFDTILSGKKQEYCLDINPYWATRLLETSAPEENPRENGTVAQNVCFDIMTMHDPVEVLKAYSCTFKHFDIIRFTNSPRTLDIECKGIRIGKVGTDNVFIISLGKIITT